MSFPNRRLPLRVPFRSPAVVVSRLRRALAPLLRLVLVVLASLTAFTPPAMALDVDSPVGRWQTFDDHTAAPSGIIHIFERDGKLFGQIERSAEERDAHDICSACVDERHGQPIDGLVIIRNMQRSVTDPREWTGGDVLDPDSGKLYHFHMRVGERGATLVVRGFLGVSLLGRTQTWKRVL